MCGRPSGLWGDPGDDTIWVVDPSHFGIHPLKLSALKQGRIEHLDPAGTGSTHDRFNYNCHFSRSRVGGSGNPALTVMWGNDDTSSGSRTTSKAGSMRTRGK